MSSTFKSQDDSKLPGREFLMGLIDELNSDGNRFNRAPTPILNSLSFVAIGLMLGFAGLSYGGQGFLIALLGRVTTAEVTGSFYSGGRHETRHLSYRFTPAGGQTIDGSTWYDQKLFDAKKVEIRYLSFRPEWNSAISGSRLFDLFKHFMICVSGFMVLGLIRLFLGALEPGTPGS